MGNRGRLHEGRGTPDVVRTYQSKTWVTCLLSFKDRWRPQWQPNQYTHLFFLDEAVAFAVGHRPCAECRLADYKVYRAIWTETYGGGAPPAAEMNDQLHRERHRSRAGPRPLGCLARRRGLRGDPRRSRRRS